MSELFQKIKKESMITSIICIVFGVMFCIWPGTILVTLCRIAGFVLLAAGIVLLIQGIRIQEMLGRSVWLLPAVVCVVIGIWILARPGVFVSLIPILDRCHAGLSWSERFDLLSGSEKGQQSALVDWISGSNRNHYHWSDPDASYLAGSGNWDDGSRYYPDL